MTRPFPHTLKSSVKVRQRDLEIDHMDTPTTYYVGWDTGSCIRIMSQEVPPLLLHY